MGSEAIDFGAVATSSPFLICADECQGSAIGPGPTLRPV
jgi:hypothetical protein